MNLILLRVMLPVDFGTYALILNAIIFFGTIQQALVIYPLWVRGARAREGQFRRLAGFLAVSLSSPPTPSASLV